MVLLSKVKVKNTQGYACALTDVIANANNLNINN